MSSISDKIKESERWKEAEKSLRDFNETMKLIEQYPIKTSELISPEPKYVPSRLLSSYSEIFL